jgi:hypothetical protein
MKSLKLFGLFLLVASTPHLGCGDVDSQSGSSLKSIAVTPTSATLSVGSAESFASLATYGDGSSAAVKATWSLSSPLGSLTLIGYNVQLLATAEGSGTITATYSGKTATAEVTVTATIEPIALSTIEVIPAAVTKRVGETETFMASGLGGSGEAIDIKPTWLISGDAIGTFSIEGTVATLETTAEGFVTISCISGEVIGYSYVTVEGYILELTVEVNAYVDSSSPEGAFLGSLVLYAGNVISTGQKNYETYLKFPLPELTSIESAILTLYATSVSPDNASIGLGTLLAPWNENLTWNTRPTPESFIGNQTFSAGSNSLDITGIAQGWVNKGNCGLRLYSDQVTTNYVSLVSSFDATAANRPKLHLEYRTH